ncbi:MAG: hypothetical protein RL497_1575, partial [Pseudomonadota bacterium]
MNYKRLIEMSFLALFTAGVGISLLIHQSYDEWLTELVEASGQRVSGGPLVFKNLHWLSAEETLSLESGQWFDTERASEPWLMFPAARWPLAGSWQGAVFQRERLELPGLVVRIQQEGLTTNINRLIKQVETVVIQPEKQRKGKEPLLFMLGACALTDVQVELHTLKHGVLRWRIPELTLHPAQTAGLAFDVLLQQLTLALL